MENTKEELIEAIKKLEDERVDFEQAIIEQHNSEVNELYAKIEKLELEIASLDFQLDKTQDYANSLENVLWDGYRLIKS